MAYAPKEAKIIPGGLNLLPPGDQVNDGDCLELTGFWPGAAGRLEQTPTLVLQTPANGAGKDTVLQSGDDLYYAGLGSLYVNDSFIDSGFDGSPLGALSFQGWNWFINPVKGRRWRRNPSGSGYQGEYWTESRPNANLFPTILAGQGGLLGLPIQYQYYFTWVIEGLGETNPSDVTVQTVSTGDALMLTLPDDITPPDDATGWNVYRQNYDDSSGIGEFSIAYLVNATPIPITQTSYVDFGLAGSNQDDTAIRELGVILAFDHDEPPPARVMANKPFNGRIVVANSPDHPNRIWWTDALEPAFFPGASNPNTGQWADIGDDTEDPVLAIAIRPLTAIIYRKKSIWRVLGDFDDPNSRIDPIVPELGIAGIRAMCSTSVGDFFIASGGRGVYQFNNDWAQSISGPVDTVWRGLPTENLPTLGKTYESQCAIGYRGGRLWCSYPLANGNAALSLIYHLASQRWFDFGVGYGAFLDAGDKFYGVNGGVYSLEDQYIGGSTVLAYQSGYYNAGLPDHEKTWADLIVNHNTQGATLTVTVRINKNDNPAFTSFVVATITSNAMTKSIIPLVYPSNYAVTELQGKPIRSYSLSIRITGNGADDAPVIIDSPMILHYYLEARKAKTFDSAATDHGTGMVKIVDQVQFDIDANAGPATLQVHSDVPGGALVKRLGTSGQVVPQTTHRGSEIVVLSTRCAGRLIRYTMTTPTDFGLFGLRARVLPIGVYLDGTIGDFWQPTPISIGV